MTETKLTDNIDENPEDVVVGLKYFVPSPGEEKPITVLIMRDHSIIQYHRYDIPLLGCGAFCYKKTTFGIRKNFSIKGIELIKIFFNGSWREYPESLRYDSECEKIRCIHITKYLEAAASEVVKTKLDRSLLFIKNSSNPKIVNIEISDRATLPIKVKYTAEKTIFVNKDEYEKYKRKCESDFSFGYIHEGLEEKICREQIEKDGEELLYVLNIQEQKKF